MTAEEKIAHDELLAKMKTLVSDELNQRSYQKKDEVEAVMNRALENMPLEALRAYEADKTKTDATITKIAAELEKVSQHRSTMAATSTTGLLRESLDKMMPEIEKRMASGGKEKGEVSFNIRAAAPMGLTNTIDDTAVPQDLIESMSMDAFVKKRRGVQYIYNVADRNVVAELDEYRTWLEEGNEQGAFALVAEGGLKPLVSTSLVRNVSKYKKIAGKYVVTEEFTKFRKNAFAIIRDLINDKLVRDYNAILSADLIAVSTAYTGSATFDHTFASPNDYDAIGVVAAQIMNLNFMPDTLVLNPTDAWKLRLEKDSENRYLFPVTTQDGVTTIFSFNLVISTYQPIGTFLLLESGLYKIWEEPVTVRMGYGLDFTTTTVSGAVVVNSVTSDIDTNRMRVIVETFFNDYIATNNIGSIVTGNFTTIKTALHV